MIHELWLEISIQPKISVRRLSHIPVKSLDQKMDIRSHMDYCDFIFHILALRNDLSHNIDLNDQTRSLEIIQYQAALAVSGAWKGIDTDKMYEKLGWQSLHSHRDSIAWFSFIK